MRGLLKHIQGKRKERPRLPGQEPRPTPACRRRTGSPASVHTFIHSFSSTHSLNKQYPSTCAVPGPVLGAGVLALRVLMVLGEQTASNRSSHQWGRNYRRMCCSAPRQRQTTVPLDKVSQAASLPPHPMMCTEPCSDPIESPSSSLGQGLAEGL